MVYFNVKYKDGILSFEHVHEGKELRGTATFDTNNNRFYVNGEQVTSLTKYFTYYGVKNKGNSYRFYQKTNYIIDDDLDAIEDIAFRTFLKKQVIWRYYKYTRSSSQNLGNILLNFHKFKNMLLWTQLGVKNCDELISIPPSDVPKDVKKFMCKYSIKPQLLTNKHAIELIRIMDVEKIPKGIEHFRSRDWDTGILTEYDIAKNWASVLEHIDIIEQLIDMGYTMKAILRYLFNYLTIYENMDIYNGLRYLKDYAKLNHDMGITEFKRFPKYLKSNHDILSAEYSNFKETYDENKLKNNVKKELEYKGNDFMVIVPSCSDDIRKEGKSLNHCVGSYISRVVEGKTQILFMRKEPDVSLVTLEVRDDVLIQAKGSCNRATTKEENKFINRYAKEKELIVRIN